MTRNREDWLANLARGLGPWFADLGYPIPAVRFAIGFPSSGKRGRVIGECWSADSSADGTHEILIRPDQADPLEVAAILAHELAHAAVGLAAGHGPIFKKVANAIGLEGPMKSTRPGDAFKRTVRPILAAVGPLPHASLDWLRSSGPPKQSTRLLKAKCPHCGYTVRITRKWIDEVGTPHCPVDGEMELIDQD